MHKALPLLWVLVAHAVAAPIDQSPDATGIPVEARLLSGDSILEDGNLVITARSGQGASTEWIHLFFDIDHDGPAFTHASGAPAGQSLDFLIESGNAYRFTGTEPHAWSWAPLHGAVLTQSAADGVTRWVLSPKALGIAETDSVRALVATYSPNYQDTLDTLPRGQTTWNVLPAARVERPASPPVRADARAAFRKIQSYACYYGPHNLERLLRRDASIIQTKTQGRANIDALRTAGHLAIGYISIGEDETLRKGDGRGPGGYDSGYFDRDGDGRPDRNGIWNSYFANAASPAWREYFLSSAAALVTNYGVDGLFLDTVETCLLYPESKPGMVSLIKELRARHPEVIIVINRAWDLLPELGDTVDGLMFESFTLSYDFGAKEYIRVRDSGIDAGLDIWNRLLKPAHDRHGLVMLALDYSETADSPLVPEALDRAVTLGMVPCLATIQLDRLHEPAHAGRKDDRWLHPKETAESRIHVMDTARNGFPEGTRVQPDSNFNDYQVAPVVDGLGFGSVRESLGWRERAWASREAPGEHFLEFTFPAPLRARTLTIEWAWEGGAWHPARSFRVEALTSGAAGAWQTIARFEGNASATNRVLLPADEFTGLRIVQNDGGGFPGRPDLMWIQQVSISP